MKNFINFPYIKFSKAKIHNWAKKKYIDSETEKLKQVQDSYSRYILLYSRKNEFAASALNQVYKFDTTKSTLYNLIKSFTYKKFDKISFGFLVQMFADMGIEVKIVDDELFVKMESLEFSVRKFSKFEPEILNQLTDLEEPDRIGKCHPYGVITARYYHKKKAYKTNLVTGRIYQFSPQAKYLHSWVEIEKDGETMVIDPTRNAVYSKEAYYFVNNVSNVVKVSSEELEKDFDIIKALTDYDNYVVKVYYENPENGRKLYNKLVALGEIASVEKEK